MLADRFGLSLSTSSAAARDAYVDASERALTFYPGALPAYDSAIAAEPGFALAHAGKAQVLMREGNVAGARAALGAAKELVAGVSEREASHIAIFDLGSTAIGAAFNITAHSQPVVLTPQTAHFGGRSNCRETVYRPASASDVHAIVIPESEASLTISPNEASGSAAWFCTC